MIFQGLSYLDTDSSALEKIEEKTVLALEHLIWLDVRSGWWHHFGAGCEIPILQPV